MTIKTKIFIILLVAAVFIMGTGVILHGFKKDMVTYHEKEKITSIILRGVFELNLLTNDFLKHPLNRTLKQWNQKYNSLLKILNVSKSKFHGEFNYFKEIDHNLNGLKITFSKMSEEIASGRRGMPVQGYDSIMLLYEAKLSTLSHDMIYNAQALEIFIRSQSKTSQDKAALYILLFFLSFAGLIIIFSGIIVYSVLRPVLLLTKGVETIGKGNFDYRIKVSTQDEIGLLSKTVNEMSRRLSEITVHRSELEKEIAERELAEKKIIESEALLRAVFEQAGGYCMILQPSDSGIPTILDVNTAACEVHGYSRDEMIGQPVADLDDEEGKRLCIERTQLIMSGEPFKIETDHVCKDGSSFPVAVYANLVRFEDKPPLIVTTEFDISDKKKTEAEKKSLEQQFLQAQKMESIGTLAGGVAHEINNPINGIMNYAQLIQDKIGEGNPLSEYASEIIHETKRVSKIVKNLLVFARHEKESHSPARIKDIIDDTMSLIQTVLKRDQITLIADISEDLPKIKCRSQQIQQVVMNLITNARDTLNEKYSGFDDNKKIEIISVFFEKDGRRWIRTTVEDCGLGIAQDTMERMFDPFYTTKERTKGTGLGLSISYGIVNDHHGKLSVESEPGLYTRFHMDLPVDNGWDLQS